MTTEIQKLSNRLAELYGVDAFTLQLYRDYTTGRPKSKKTWLAEDSGRISDLADDNGVNIEHSLGGVFAIKKGKIYPQCYIQYSNHPTKHDAARMARVKCLIAIKE